MKKGQAYSKMVKLSIYSLLVGLMIGVTGFIAEAAYSKSSNGSFGPISGVYYQNYSTLDTGSNFVLYGSNVSATRGGPVPSGYMGISQRLYNSNGTLCVSRPFAYNSGSSYNYNRASSTVEACGKGKSYYSKGRTQAYNGNGYTTYATFQTATLRY